MTVSGESTECLAGIVQSICRYGEGPDLAALARFQAPSPSSLDVLCPHLYFRQCYTRWEPHEIQKDKAPCHLTAAGGLKIPIMVGAAKACSRAGPLPMRAIEIWLIIWNQCCGHVVPDVTRVYSDAPVTCYGNRCVH